MNLKNYFPVLSNSYVTFQQLGMKGLLLRELWPLYIWQWTGQCLFQETLNLDWTDNLKWLQASMPLLVLIFILQNVAKFYGTRKILLGWCWGLRSEEFMGIWDVSCCPAAFYNGQCWIMPYQECDKLTQYMFSCEKLIENNDLAHKKCASIAWWWFSALYSPRVLVTGGLDSLCLSTCGRYLKSTSQLVLWVGCPGS